MIRFTKRQLIERVVNEAANLDDYLNAGGLPTGERAEMDNEFYADYVQPVWDNISEFADAMKNDPLSDVLRWSFDHDLTRGQMQWIEQNRQHMSLSKVMLGLSKNFGDRMPNVNSLNAKIYRMMKDRKLDSTDSVLRLSLELFLKSLPQI